MGTSGLGALLVEEGLLTEMDRRTIKRTCGTHGSAFARAVIALGLLDEDELAAFLAERTRWRVTAKDLAREASRDAFGAIDRPLIERLEVLPLSITGQTLHVAMVDPLDHDTVKQIEFFTGYRVLPHIATFTQIRQGLERLLKGYRPQSSHLEDLLNNHALSAGRRLRLLDQADAKTPRVQKKPKNAAAHDDADELRDIEEPKPSRRVRSSDMAGPSDQDGADLEYPDSVDAAEAAKAPAKRANPVASPPKPKAPFAAGDPGEDGFMEDDGDLPDFGGVDGATAEAEEAALAALAGDPALGAHELDDAELVDPTKTKALEGLEGLEDLEGIGDDELGLGSHAEDDGGLGADDFGFGPEDGEDPPANTAADDLGLVGDEAFGATAGSASGHDDLLAEIGGDSDAALAAIGEAGDDDPFADLADDDPRPSATARTTPAAGGRTAPQPEKRPQSAAPSAPTIDDDLSDLFGDDEPQPAAAGGADLAEDDEELAFSGRGKGQAADKTDAALADTNPEEPDPFDAESAVGGPVSTLAAGASDDLADLLGDPDLDAGDDLDALFDAGASAARAPTLGDESVATGSDVARNRGAAAAFDLLGETEPLPKAPKATSDQTHARFGTASEDAFDAALPDLPPMADASETPFGSNEWGDLEDVPLPHATAAAAELFGDDPLSDLPSLMGDLDDSDLGADIAALASAAASGSPPDLGTFDDEMFEESLADAAVSPAFDAASAADAAVEDAHAAMLAPTARASGDSVRPAPTRAPAGENAAPGLRSAPAAAGPASEAPASEAVVANLNRALLGLSLASDFHTAAHRAVPALARSGLRFGLLLAQDGKQATPLLAWETPPGLSAPEIAAQNLYRFAPQALVAGLARYGDAWQPAHDAARAADFKPLSAWAAGGEELMALALPAADGKRLVAIVAWSPAEPGVKDAARGILRRLAQLL